MKGVRLRDRDNGQFVADAEPPLDGTVRQVHVEEPNKKKK